MPGPQTRGVVAPTGPSYVFSLWEAPGRARRTDVYTGLVPKGLLSLGGILGGGNSRPIPGAPAGKVARWKSYNFPMPLGQGQEQSTIQQGDPRLGWWLLPRGHLMYFHFGMHRVGQDGALYEFRSLPI